MFCSKSRRRRGVSLTSLQLQMKELRGERLHQKFQSQPHFFLRRKSVTKIHKQNEYSRWNIFTDMTDVDFFQDFIRKALVVYVSPLQQLAFRILTRCNGEPENLVFHRSIPFVHRKSRKYKRTHLVDKYRPLKGKEGLYLPSSRYRFHTW